MTRLRHQAQVNPLSLRFDQLSSDELLPFLPMEKVWPGASLDLTEVRAKFAVSVGYTRFQSGDVLVPKITPTFEAGRAVVVPDLPRSVGVGTTEFHVVRPGLDVDPRFLQYVFHACNFLKLGESEMLGVAGQKRVPEDFVKDWDIGPSSLDGQRRIVDFLDRETGRIDRLRGVVERLISAARKRRDVAFTAAIDTLGGPRLDLLESDLSGGHPGWREAALSKVLVKLTNGYVGPTRDILVDDPGVRYVQSLHVKNGGIDFQRKPYYVSDEWAQCRPRISLAAGDILIVQTGAIGEVALVDAEYAGSSCHALLICRADLNAVDTRYLFHLLRSHWGRHLLLMEQTGALHPHLEAGKVRDIRIPVPSLEVQRCVVSACEASEAWFERLRKSSSRQLDLLAERRQALITAAVTGQIDVTTARGADV